MRRPTSIGLVLLVGILSAVPAAHAHRSAHASKTYSSSHRYFQQHAAGLGGVSINVTVVYAKKHRDSKNTPRAVYVKFQAPVSCQGGEQTAAAVASGPFKLKHRKVEFSGSFTNQAPASEIRNPGSSGLYYATGRLIKKKNKRKRRVDGTVTVLTYSSPPTFLNCTSGEIPYSASQCWSSAPAWSSPPFCTDAHQAGRSARG